MKVQQEEEEPSLSCQLISLSYAIYHDLSLHIYYPFCMHKGHIYVSMYKFPAMYSYFSASIEIFFFLLIYVQINGV